MGKRPRVLSRSELESVRGGANTAIEAVEDRDRIQDRDQGPGVVDALTAKSHLELVPRFDRRVRLKPIQ